MQAIQKKNQRSFYYETATKVLVSARGFSLVDVVTSAGVAAVVALGSAALITQTKVVSNQGEFQASLDSQHNQDILRAKNTSFVMDRIVNDPNFAAPIPDIAIVNYSSVSSSGGGGSSSYPYSSGGGQSSSHNSGSVSAGSNNTGRLIVNNPCFRGGGTNCQAYNRDWTDLGTSSAVTIQTEEGMNGITADKKLFRKTRYKLVCDTNKCDRIVLQVTTRPSRESDCTECHLSAENRGLRGKDRITELEIPVSAFADKNKLNYDCVDQGKALTAVNYNNLKTNCDGYPHRTQCSGNIAAVGYGGADPDCYAAVSTGSCSKGVRVAGPNAGSCN